MRLGATTLVLLGFLVFLPIRSASAQGVPATCPVQLGTADLIDHNFSVSFCELCDVGTVRIEIENPFNPTDDLDFADLIITEDLLASGLTYVANTTSFSGANISVPAPFEPTVGGPNGGVLAWNFGPSGLVMVGRPGGPGNRARLALEFDVERAPSVSEEGLVAANRTIDASIELEPSCGPGETFLTSTGPGTLPLNEPIPVVTKRGRNLDAAQGSGSYSDPVYGHQGDDVIWRIRVRNIGNADLQDFVFTDAIDPGNFLIDYVCDSETDATNAATGGPIGDCVLVGPTTSVANLDVAATFGNGANPYIVAPAGGRGFYYLVGEITSSCSDQTNRVSGVEWGCQSEPPAGGIAATSGGASTSDDALLRALSIEAGVDINVALTGINTAQPMGATGTVTITITNNSGGTIKGEAAGLRINNLLPAEYVVDTTFAPTINVNPAYGTYAGMLDTLAWTNPASNTVPLVTPPAANPADPLSNTDLDFVLTSSTVQTHATLPDKFNMIRHGDVVTVTFRTVLIDPTYYDYVANLDVRVEAPNSDPAGTDPTETFPISSRTEVWWEEYCSGTLHNDVITENDTAEPEDIDIDISGSELIFILTNTGDPLPLTVNLTNNGGHNADDYAAYVTFGEAMVVQTVPAGCSATTNPPTRPVWTDPVALPATASVYVCDRGIINPGETESLNFEVVKNTAATFDDDLTFRADVIGEITLSDGSTLWFPPPAARADSVLPRANDYSVDTVWARVIGFNLFKEQLGLCSENNLPPNNPDIEIEIGEECSFHVESGGWFGFQTPGFTYIAVQNIQVVDEIPNGQGYISSTDPLATSTPAILGVSLNPPPAPLDEAFFDWTFNTVTPAERITEKDHWFRVDVRTRLLNDPLDTSAPPNEHAAPSSNVMTSTFDAVFFNQSTSQEELFNLGPNTLGFPREVHRRVDLTVTEPNLIVTKEVCNEALYGVGASCSNFVPLANDGDAFDTYIFRVTVENEASSGGVTRAPAYDVTVTSVADSSDQLFVDPLTGDVIDNDGDALIDGGDAAGEGTLTDNILENGTPAEIIASYTHSDALLRIDPGDSVVLYYRVDPSDDVAPLQMLTGSASATYDSLEGNSGAQGAPLGANGETGGARQYTSAVGQATIQIIPVEVSPKQILRVSNSALVLPINPQPVSIGEEVEFQLEALIPVARLRNFEIRDQLPVGMSCTDAPVVDLDAAPYSAAGFIPGGSFTPTCTNTEVVWSFGNQTVTMSNRVDRRFEFEIQFIARVDNIMTNQEGVIVRNGGNSTVTEVRYINEAGTPVVLSIGEAALVIQEPLLAVTKTFSVAEVDAGDRPRITVTLTNNGSTTAYNPRVLDDLSGVELAYVGNITGSDPPTDDIVTLGPDFPIFSWAPGFSIAPGASTSFSFAVEVAATVQPERTLANTVQADWTSLPSQSTALIPSGAIGPNGSAAGMRIGALPNAADPLNDYEAEANAVVPVAAVTVEKLDLDPTQSPEIGVHKSFQIEIQLPEGVTQDVIASDALDSGSVSYVLAHNATYDITYEFIGIDTINASPPGEAAFVAVPVDGTSGTAIWSIGAVTTFNEDDLATQAITPAIRIRYSARINNDLATNVGSPLQNTATIYSTHGETSLQTSVSDTTDVVTAIESALTATKVLINVTPGKLATDPPAFNDILQYVVTIVNGGNAAAYDINIVDTLPLELELATGFTPTATIDTAPVAGFVGVPSGAPGGPLIWGRQNADNSLDIAQGSFLELTYQVNVSAPPIDGSTISNNIWTDWTSLDIDPGGLYERTGAGCPTVTAPNDYCYGPAVAQGTVDPAPPASPLVKENTQTTAAVGEVFRYRITVPQAPYAFPIYDVRIYDDLTNSAADLRFLSVTRISGSAAWTPVNTGTATDLVLEDTSVGIDIPTGEQVVLEIAVVLEDTPTNVTGLAFTNTANYVYNWVNGNVTAQRMGAAGTTPPMTIVGPDTLTLEKSGPASMALGSPATFTLDVHNTGDGPAWNLTLLDLLPNAPIAGTCDQAPAGFTAQIFESDGLTPVSAVLAEGTDFSVAFRGDPDCDLAITMLTPAATVGADERLIVTYDAVPDNDSQNGETLTNVAGATEWFSADGSIPETTADLRVFTRVLTDGTVGVLDHEDAYTTTVALPIYTFEKTVVNVTTGQNPATLASPGDLLRYQLRLENLRNAPLDNLTIVDELDRLNATPAFEPGTLQLITVPAAADTSNTSATGGASGTGLLDVRGLSLAGLNDSLIVEFEITLAPVLTNGTAVANQSQLSTGGVPFADSDDPNVNGAADPFVPGDEDPTSLLIVSAPDFQVEKTSAYLTGDPNILLAGEMLRYTIIVKNVGSDDASDAMLRDAIPVNTAYVSGSTTLNGLPVADGVGGVSPLVVGLPIYAPENTTPGAMRADASAAPDNVATLTFAVIVDAGAIDGTVISNQAFVSAVLGGVSDQPSDDPGTAIVNDPTRDVVGNSPLLFAPKSAALLFDLGTPGVVDPGDTLRYTITVYNNGATVATQAILSDSVPANTTYVADSLTLNGMPASQPDGGVSPLIAGIAISSSDLTPPLPATGAGQLTPGASATITFDLQVNAAVAGGTIISNQALVRSAELPNLLTDGDGNPATGPEPTLVVVGAGEQLAITKQVTVVGGGAALAGGQLEYVVRVTNIGTTPANNVVITDDLDQPIAGQLSYVVGSATLDGAATGLSVVGSLLTADYSTSFGALPPGASTVLRFRTDLGVGLAMGTTVINTGNVVWNTPPQTVSASVSISIGGMPGVGTLNGAIWHDANFDRSQGATERRLAGWFVDLYRNGQLVQSVQTNANGVYQIVGVAPNDVTGDTYELRFRASDAGANTAALGRTESAFGNGLQSITNLVVPSGSNLQALHLPIDPNGVVYEAVLRSPVAGTTVTMLAAGNQSPVASGCFDDPLQQGQVTGSDGYYKFDMNFSNASCPSGADYVLSLTPPGSDFVGGNSQIIPALTDATTLPFGVPSCPGGGTDALPITAQHCEVQVSEFAPPPSAIARSPGTNYHLHLTLDASQTPGSSQLFNNHIPLDPVLGGAVAITKTTPSINVSRGNLVPYEITFNNALPVALAELSLRDRYPAGFRYVEKSARVDGVAIEPTISGRDLTWTNLGVGPSSSRTVVLLLAVGAGVTEGEFINRAQAFSSLTGLALSGQASATVRVVPDLTFDCTDVIGKVFDDRNRDGVQDEGEEGLPGVRIMTVRGLAITTDPFGRFHITCALVPNEVRGSNFVLKLDDRTLPSGFRMTTRQTQVKRATRGKALRFQFGASINRVVGLDLADAVFEPGAVEMREQWVSRLMILLDELEKSESILRLSYVADIEDPLLVEQRLESVKQAIMDAWKARDRAPLRIETDIYWRRGSPVETPARERETSSLQSRLPPVGAGPPGFDTSSGQSSERQFPLEPEPTQWTVDPEVLDTQLSDRLEEREVLTEKVDTVKLKQVVPPIRFESGGADISPSYVAMLQTVLDNMRDLDNVRLHLVGHADNQVLSGELRSRFGDNEGLSRERAGDVAEFLQAALSLPPESISYAWAGEAQPVASNATREGRALNRRVEVEVWYDEIGEEVVVKEVVIPEEIKRFKVCRTETVCKLRYREGNERRARVKNLIPPLDYDTEVLDIPEKFVRQIEEALFNLRDKQNVTVKFIAHTDDVPLTGRAERIYGTHLSISKARAHRVALEIKDALNLPTAAVASEGRGASRPVASNATPRGRALNRRIEVEFWHDDPLLELSEELQICPDAADAETVTRLYDPPGGRFEVLQIVDGEALIPSGFAVSLRRAMDEVEGRDHVRLRFIGYTSNERLTRRMAEAYIDDVGLSTARARRTMERIQGQLELTDDQVEHEGRGFVQSEDVVNGGFIQGGTSHVIVQVVYDELAVMDDYDGIEITPITRELRPRDPLSLNLMRITVDGEPIDDPGRSSADIQRCTDVALEDTAISFVFDDLQSQRRLNVSATPESVRAGGSEPVRFRMYSNYPHYIERAEVRIFDADDSVRAEPLAIAKVDRRGFAEWLPPAGDVASSEKLLKFVVRAYGEDGLFDETAPQALWMAPTGVGDPAESSDADVDLLLAGYGESESAAQNIQVGSTGAVKVGGSGIPPDHTVWLAGTELPVDAEGNFIGEVLLPEGLHTVEVAVLDAEGNGELFLRDLELKRDDWFFVGIADLTLSMDLSGNRPNELDGNNATDLDSFADGRLAFFTKGKFGDDWKLTASADTREGPVKNLFTNFLDKSPDSLFRRLDPDYYYPTFGDDSSIEEMTPTNGKFYVKLSKGDDHLMWGNFTVRYTDNELALVERGLYGANARFQSDATTAFGERRVVIDAFAADPGTVSSREEFRGTGGSVYFLKRRDLLIGSERLRIEVRDKASGLVSEVVHLQPELDYDIDYIQGRVLLSEPISAIANDRLLVRSDGLSGNEVWLVTQYEYTPGFDNIDTLNTGAQGHFWMGDYAKLGVTANNNGGDADSSLYAADLTLRKSANSWLKVQAGRSDGLVSVTLRSDDGGFGFEDPVIAQTEKRDAYGYRADLSIGLGDWWSRARGQLSVYGQHLDAGYSAPGLATQTDTEQYGGVLRVPVTSGIDVVAKADRVVQEDGLETLAAEVDVTYQISDAWSVQVGARHDERDDNSDTVVATQDQGDRTDTVVQLDFDTKTGFRTYAFGQATVRSTRDREDNNRGGVGGAYRINEKISVDGEASHGTLGTAAQVGATYQHTERSKLYVNYALDDERGYDGRRKRKGNVTVGSRSRLSDSASVYAENQYQHGTVTGLTRSVGITYAPIKTLSLGFNWEDGDLRDRQTQAETARRAGGFRVGYNFEDLSISSGIEYIFNDTEQSDRSKSERTTWLFRNSLKYQMNEDGRLTLKFNHAISDSSEGDFFDGGFTEAVLGYAYRPIAHDRFNAIVKYTYFYNVPTTDQVGQNGTSSQFIQKSHVAAIDVTYDLTRTWTIGAKYAYRLSQVSLDREDTDFFDNNAHLYILRADWRFLSKWEGLLEGRVLDLPDQDERRAGALVTLYRYLGEHLKVGIGYNFTDFSEDLTDLSYDSQGVFFNVLGTY